MGKSYQPIYLIGSKVSIQIRLFQIGFGKWVGSVFHNPKYTGPRSIKFELISLNKLRKHEENMANSLTA